jgi:hypothetical protein
VSICYEYLCCQKGRHEAACYAHASQTSNRYYVLQDRVARFGSLQTGWRARQMVSAQLQREILLVEDEDRLLLSNLLYWNLAELSA